MHSAGAAAGACPTRRKLAVDLSRSRQWEVACNDAAPDGAGRGSRESPMTRRNLRSRLGFLAWVLVCVLDVCLATVVSTAQEPEDLWSTVVTQWMDPTGRRPVSYMGWISAQPPHRDMIHEVVVPPREIPPDVQQVWVLVRDALHDDLLAPLDTYTADLVAQGYGVHILVGDFATAAALRSYLQTQYTTNQLVGVVIIGDWPVPWFEMDDDFYGDHSEFPCDLYYMDLDGLWSDQDADGLLDSHVAGTGDLGPEIWVGRLTFSPLTQTAASEADLLTEYFERDHMYRVGQLCHDDQALAYIDDDWSHYDTCGEIDLCTIYGSGQVSIFAEPESTTAADYKVRYLQNYEFIHVMSHGSPGGHGFYENDKVDFNWVSVSDVINDEPWANFYNLFVCSGCRYVESNYLGGWYINTPYGLAAIGSTKTGSMLNFPDFYGVLSTGSTLGDAFKVWFDGQAAGGFELWERQWFYGMTLLGDPTLGPDVIVSDPYEPNDTCATAYDLGTLTTSYTSSEYAHFSDENEDWYSLQVPGAGLLVMETTCIGEGADTVIWLYDACGGALLAADDESGPGSGSRIECAVGPGTYKLLIDQCADHYGSCSNYSFTIELRPIPDITVTGADPIVLTILEGATKDFTGLLSVRNDGQPGSSLGFRIVEQDVTTPTAPAPSATGSRDGLPFSGNPAPGKSLLPKLSEPDSEWTLLLVDPDEAEAGPGDIAYVYAQIHDEVLYFRVVSHEAWDDDYTGLETYIWLDIDQDPATGCASDDLGMYLDDIGAEFCITVHGEAGELWSWSVETAKWHYEDAAVYLSLSPNSSEFGVGIALSQLRGSVLPPGDSGGFDITCWNAWAELADCAPDEGLGHVTYPPSVGFLSCIPDEGTLAVASTSALTLRVAASALSAGDSRRVRLFFMGNDPDELLTRDVVINVVGGTPAVFRVDPSGIVRADGPFYGSAFLTGSADVAEWVTVSEPVEPGDVLELDPWSPGQYRKAVGPCSSLVAGVVSTEPGFALGSPTHYVLPTANAQALLALVGMVPVKACDENGPIALGDLLVPSSIPGYVMRWDDERFPSCMPVGKALGALARGEGAILALLMP